MAAKVQKSAQHPLRVNIPGRNDLEVLENLKNIIKSNQHEIYKPIPQPDALLAQYRGPIPPLSDKNQPLNESIVTRIATLAKEAPPQRGLPTPTSSNDLQQQQATDPPRTALVHDLPPRPDQRPALHPNGHPQARTSVEARATETSQPYRYSDKHYSPPRGTSPNHYHRERDGRTNSQDGLRDIPPRDERERSPGGWDARRPDLTDYRDRREDRRTYHPRPPPEERHYEPSPERSAALANARRPSEDLERRRIADNCYPPKDRRPSDGSRLSASTPYLPPEDRSYRPTDNGSRVLYSPYEPEHYTPPSNYDTPQPRTSSTYDRESQSGSRTLDKRPLPASVPTLEERLSAPRPSLQERIGPLSTPVTNSSPSSNEVRSSGGKQVPTLEQRLNMPPPSSAARPPATQQAQSQGNSGSSNGGGSTPASRNYGESHYSPPATRDTAPVAQDSRAGTTTRLDQRPLDRYTRTPPPAQGGAPAPTRAPPSAGTPSTHASYSRENDRSLPLKRSPSPPVSVSIGQLRGNHADNRSQGECGLARQSLDMDVDKNGSNYNKPPYSSGDIREADRTGRPAHQPPQQQSQPQQQHPSTSSTAASPPASVPPLSHAERRALALSREMQDALYKPPQHVQVTTTVERRRDVYPDDSQRGRSATWTDRDREASQSRSAYPIVDDRRPVYRDPPPRTVYDTPPARPPPSSRDVYLDERDRSYHPPPPLPDSRDYDRPRYLPHDDDLPPSHSAYPLSRVRPRSRSPIMDSRRSDIDMRPPPMKRPRDDLYTGQTSAGGGSSYYPPQRDYPPPSSNSYYPSESSRDVRPRDSRDYLYDGRGSRAGDGYLPRYEDDRRYLSGGPPRS